MQYHSSFMAGIYCINYSQNKKQADMTSCYESLPQLEIKTSENTVFEAHFKNLFDFMGKLCSVLKIFMFLYLKPFPQIQKFCPFLRSSFFYIWNHFIKSRGSDFMKSISTYCWDTLYFKGRREWVLFTSIKEEGIQ